MNTSDVQFFVSLLIYPFMALLPILMSIKWFVRLLTRS